MNLLLGNTFRLGSTAADRVARINVSPLAVTVDDSTSDLSKQMRSDR
jgi:hypothetical protein